MSATLLCLALTVFHEARGEPEFGQVAVAKVVINRASIRRIPECDVLLEVGQFSWDTGKYVGKDQKIYRERLPVMEKGWEKSVISAKKALKMPETLGNIEFFHATYVFPAWKPRYIEVFRVGGHVFYARNPQFFDEKSGRRRPSGGI